MNSPQEFLSDPILAMLAAKPIFCCSNAVPSYTSQNNKPHNDANRSIHDRLFRAFLEFAKGRKKQLTANGIEEEDHVTMLPDTTPRNAPWAPGPVLTPEALANNPIKDKTQYVIHLTSRHDYRFVFSHRYFTCPEFPEYPGGMPEWQFKQFIELDWPEMTLVHWFAKGYPFRLSAEKWDVKCPVHGKFFRLSLRPNLNLRKMRKVQVKKPEPMNMPLGEGEEHEKFFQMSLLPNLNLRKMRKVQVKKPEPMNMPLGEGEEHEKFFQMSLRANFDWRQQQEIEANKPEINGAVGMETLDDMDGDTAYTGNTDGEAEAESKPEINGAVDMETLDDMDGDTEYMSNIDGEAEAESIDI